MSAFPWAQAMQFGLGTLKLSPRQFWAMTPRELQAAFEGWRGKSGKPKSIERSKFDQMMQAFPDKEYGSEPV